MKTFYKIGLTVMIAVCSLAIAAEERAMRTASPALNVWSGRTVELDLNATGQPDADGAWRLEQENGRVLVSGAGKIAFRLPPLNPGAKLDAVLIYRTGGREQRTAIRIWSPQALAGLPPVILDAGSRFNAKLRDLGLTEGRQGLTITDKPDAVYLNPFPLIVLTRQNSRVPFPCGENVREIKISGHAERDAWKKWLYDDASMPPGLRLEIRQADGNDRIIFGAGFSLDDANDAAELIKIIEQSKIKR